MSKDFREVPDGVAFENNHVNQLILSWMGKGGQGVPMRQTEVSDAARYAVDVRNKGTGGKHLRVTHSSGSPVLMDVTDAGVLLSVGGGNPTNALIYPKSVIGWTGAASTIPSGYAVITASKNAFPYGANADGDLGATGGAATINTQHTHVQNAHSHGHAHGSTVQSETASTGGNNDEQGDAISGTANTYSLIGHEHNVIIPADATGATPTNQNAGSTTQSILPPFWRCYWIERS